MLLEQVSSRFHLCVGIDNNKATPKAYLRKNCLQGNPSMLRVKVLDEGPTAYQPKQADSTN